MHWTNAPALETLASGVAKVAKALAALGYWAATYLQREAIRDNSHDSLTVGPRV